MKSIRSRISTFLCCAGLFLLIIDTKTALAGMQQAIDLCFHTVVPSLFPFIFLSSQINTNLSGQQIHILAPLNRVCAIPKGAESIWMLGILGGYPVGAQMVCQAWKEGRISASDARRMLGFCSNAGPAFIFGIGITLLPKAAVWLLWGIHIFSAIVVGMILPKHEMERFEKKTPQTVSITKSIENSIGLLSLICGWVILFRVMLAFMNRWIMWLFPTYISHLITGVMELTNGCANLLQIAIPAHRFLLMSMYLGFGGICVGMQTFSAAKGLGTGWYFPGKLLQGTISLLLANGLQSIAFTDSEIQYLPCSVSISMLFILVFCTIILQNKKTVAFHGDIMYNERKLRT